MTFADTAELRRQLAADLVSKGAIRTREWLNAFERVPRHLFVPRYSFQYGDPAVDQNSEEWLPTIYSDTGLITDWGDDGRSCSSSSTPSIMAWMLEALDVSSGQRVLEVGTGSGYNAALLCERVGSHHVTSIDIDPDLTEKARCHLQEAGYDPTLAVADGYAGFPDNSPYDRLIGTCYIWPIPPAWLSQVRPGGRVVAVIPNGLVTLTVGEDGSASGRVHPEGFGFMYMRGGHMPKRLTADEATALLEEHSVTRSCRLPSRITEAGQRWAFWFFWGLLVTQFEDVQSSESGALTVISESDRSWFKLDYDTDTVTQGGPRRLWDEIEDLYGQWCRLGAPNRERFGLTVYPNDRHVLWLDNSESKDQWELNHGPAL